MSKARMVAAWLLALVGLLVLSVGAAKGLAKHRAQRVEVGAEEEQRKANCEQALAEALRCLEADPEWVGPKVVRTGDQSLVVEALNRWQTWTGSYSPDGLTWLPAHGVLLKVSSGGAELTRRVAVPQAPVWRHALTTPDLGPFRSPLARAPERPGQAVRLTRLQPGSYDQVVIPAGASVELGADLMGARSYRFGSLTLEPGAALTVAEIRACPAVIFVEQSLLLRGENSLNWRSDKPGAAAMLQVYGAPGARVRIQNSQSLSLVIAAPQVELIGSTVRGAVAGRIDRQDGGEVFFEEALSGIPLQGLGPWTI